MFQKVLKNDCCIYQPSRYSSFIEDLQKGSDEELIAELNMSEELPFQENSHFKNFAIKYRNAESMEDVKTVIANLEKDALLLDLIPNAFNEDLESKIQSASLFVDTPNSINFI